jgi:predicted nuclease with TOPRIM domain
MVPPRKDEVDIDTEHRVDDLTKLKAMEASLKDKCAELDKEKEELTHAKDAHEKNVNLFNQKYAILDASDAFNKMVTLVNEIYTMYVAQHDDDEGLYDSIKLLLDARSNFTRRKDELPG